MEDNYSAYLTRVASGGHVSLGSTRIDRETLKGFKYWSDMNRPVFYINHL